MAGYDLSEAYVLKKLHNEKIKEPEKEIGEKCITEDEEYENASLRSCLCGIFKKDRVISNARSMRPAEDLITSKLKEKKEYDDEEIKGTVYVHDQTFLDG